MLDLGDHATRTIPAAGSVLEIGEPRTFCPVAAKLTAISPRPRILQGCREPVQALTSEASPMTGLDLVMITPAQHLPAAKATVMARKMIRTFGQALAAESFDQPNDTNRPAVVWHHRLGRCSRTKISPPATDDRRIHTVAENSSAGNSRERMRPSCLMPWNRVIGRIEVQYQSGVFGARLNEAMN